MKDIQVTTYRGFSNVTGETTLKQSINDIRTGKYLSLVQKIEKLVEEGKKEEANQLKKQLPHLTLTANYNEKRLAYSIIRYNSIITIDIDGLADRQIAPLRERIEKDEATLACFLTPKRHGFKVFVYLRTPYAVKLRQSTFREKEITYRDLEKHHALMYEASREYLEELLGVPVDTSGKDISRGYFTSFDPQAYLNTQLLEEIEPLDIHIIAPQKEAGRAGRKKKEHPEKALDTDISHVQLWEIAEYRKALATTRRAEKFIEGNRNNFLFILGNRCYKKKLDEQSAVQLIQRDFGNSGIDVTTPVHNAYTYTDKTEEAEKETVINQVIDFLTTHYDIRRNVILDRLEFIDLEEKDTKWKGVFRPLRNKDYNSIFVKTQMAGIKCFQNYLRAVIDSNYAKNFNPFTDYFYGLKPWDGATDYIGRLAETAQAEDQAFWKESLTRWLVGMVACALRDEAVNQYVLLLYSAQGKGKSSWIRRLLPPQLKEYYRNGMIDPGNKDDLLLLSNRLLINMEEFEGAKQGDIAGLKRIITQESVTERKVYDMQADLYIRRASFAASTNNRQCMQDLGGNRRFLMSVLEEIDYRTPIEHEGVYAQALYLMEHGYRYWYEGEEIDRLNQRNEQHRMKEPVEENLYVYYRAATAKDLDTKWRPAAAIMGTLCTYGKLQGNKQTLQTLVQILEKGKFNKRVNEHGMTEYAIVEYSMEQVSRNARQHENSIKSRNKNEQEKLPF